MKNQSIKQRKRRHPLAGEICKNCGHVIYWYRRHGYRCMCDNPEISEITKLFLR